MTPEELRRVFHVDSHDQGMDTQCSLLIYSVVILTSFLFSLSVPTYEVINLRSIVRRNADQDIRHVDLSAFGER